MGSDTILSPYQRLGPRITSSDPARYAKSMTEMPERMIELNDKYAVDGRNPNSYSGIFWCLGRYDRPWGPERPIFGKIRYMSSDSARRKLDLGPYLAEFGPLSLETGAGSSKPSS